ncbi:MAG: hypothetical protein ABEJ03_04545 [Candidatus Nanohaloarchaea archaeon]
MLKPDPMGMFDLLMAVIMYFTASPVPESFAMAHVGFLAVKGAGSCVSVPLFPPGFHVLGLGADIVSAGILLIGTPPISSGIVEILSAVLLLKGAWSFFGIMAMG